VDRATKRKDSARSKIAAQSPSLPFPIRAHPRLSAVGVVLLLFLISVISVDQWWGFGLAFPAGS